MHPAFLQIHLECVAGKSELSLSLTALVNPVSVTALKEESKCAGRK